MRKYEPIWEALKKDLKVKLTAESSLHKRIITAVRKEKARDYGWKLLQSEKGIRYKLRDSSIGTVLTFTLEIDESNYIADMKL